MTNTQIRLLTTAFSMKKEIRLIFITFSIILLLPILAVIILTQEGFNLISNLLVTNDSQTANVQIHDPKTGQVTYTITQPEMWPVHGKVTLEFGQSDFPYEVFHTGIDIAVPIGTPVKAFMDGTVTYAGTDSWGYGTHIIIDNGHSVTSLYGHLSQLGVIQGQQVQMGQVIGLSGSTGWSTGPHLHFQIDVYGIPVNPRTFLQGNP